jgi:hypothetical protein
MRERMMEQRKSWVIGVLEILAILTLIGGAVLAFALGSAAFEEQCVDLGLGQPVCVDARDDAMLVAAIGIGAQALVTFVVLWALARTLDNTIYLRSQVDEIYDSVRALEEGEDEDEAATESSRTEHPGLRVTAYSDDWALGESVDQQRWVIVNQHSGVREAFVSVEQAEAEFENRTGGKNLHV